MRARTLMLAVFIFLLAPFAARAATVLYSQPNQSGDPIDISDSSKEFDLLQAPTPLTDAPLWLDFRIKAPAFAEYAGEPNNGGARPALYLNCWSDRWGYEVALEWARFPSVDYALLADGQYHDLHLLSTSAFNAVADCDPAQPYQLEFNQLGEGAFSADDASGNPSLILSQDPPEATSSSYIIATGGQESPPYDGDSIELVPDQPWELVQSGVMSDLLAPVVSTVPLSGGEQFYIQRVDEYGYAHYDCSSPVESAEQLGMSLIPYDPEAPLAHFTLEGSGCLNTGDSSHLTHFAVYNGDGTPANNIVFMTGKDGILPFTVYGNGLPQAPAAPTPSAHDSSVLFIPGMEASRLYMKEPGGSEQQVWEPAFNADIPYLAMNPDGTSAYPLYTKDIIDTVFHNDSAVEQNLAQSFDAGDLEVYSGLETFLNSLVASSTISEWRAYPYDWRYDPIDVVNDGTETEVGGQIERVYLEDVLEQMASSSPTGKVTIIAHSNGGLIAKALAEKLGEGAAKYIDRIIFVGVPQYGTPAAISSLLHGDGESQGLGIVMDGATVRAAAEYMPDIYALMPSQEYFAGVSTPVVAFAHSLPDYLAPFRSAYGDSISTFAPLQSFLEDAGGLGEAFSSPLPIDNPLTLSPSLLQKANETHALLDSWQPPAGVSVTAIAGWGQLTSATLSYTSSLGHLSCTRSGLFSLPECGVVPELEHAETKTEDGDGTVVSPSAVGEVSDAWYFNSRQYNRAGFANFTHQDLTSAQPIQDTITDLLEGKPISEAYIVSTKPPATVDPLTIITAHSPVNLVATDASGNRAGVIPVPGSDLSLAVQDIPGSAVDFDSGEEQLTLPQSGIYSIVATGYASGEATLEVQNVDAAGVAESDELFQDIPVTASTSATFSLEDGAASDAQVDVDGDGQIDVTVSAGTPAALPPSDALALLKQQFEALDTRPGVKNRLLEQLQKIAGEADNLASAQSDVSWLETLIKAQAGVKLTAQQGASMLGLLQYLQL